MNTPKNLRDYIQLLRQNREIVDVFHEVDPYLELAEIHRRVAASEGPALFFHHIKGSAFPVVSNLFGSPRRIHLAFPQEPHKKIEKWTHYLSSDRLFSWKKIWKHRQLFKGLLNLGTLQARKAAVCEEEIFPVDLQKIPFTKSWPLDGGGFLTLPLVYTKDIHSGVENLGMYRIQRHGASQCGLHWQISKGGGYHFQEAEALGRDLFVNIFLGGAPALILSAIMPLPENVGELMMASFLQDKKISLKNTAYSPLPVIGECEFALLGKALSGQRKMEGPFGDHYGYYSLQHPYPIFECERIYHRKNAIFPATVVGKPKQEDYYIGEYLQELLQPLIRLSMPGVKELWSYAQTGFHALASAKISERYFRQSMTGAFRILGEGQLALTKCLLICDQEVDLKNFPCVLKTVLERLCPQTGLYIFSHLCLDTLDYTGPKLNQGSRAVFLGTGKVKRKLPNALDKTLPSQVKCACVFTPGCLVIEIEKYQTIESIIKDPCFEKWPLVVVVDEALKTCEHPNHFLWTVFTRFDPARDLYSREKKVHHHHICYEIPIVIDARMKANYPQELLCDEETSQRVSKNWRRYFPQKMAMGDSLSGHVYFSEETEVSLFPSHL